MRGFPPAGGFPEDRKTPEGRAEKPQQQAEQCGLPCAVRTDDRDELPGANGEVGVAPDGAAPIADLQMVRVRDFGLHGIHDPEPRWNS